MSYQDFLADKAMVAPTKGIAVDEAEIHDSLFDFQRDLTRWALAKGSAAIFAGTGMGKTRMQVEWARLTRRPTLILAPLAVAHQTIAEAADIGVEIGYARNTQEATGEISITNYERLEAFDPDAFGAVVLDESSILKSFSGIVKKRLVETFKATDYRLCCTATPAPNDVEELCNHADFLGVMSPQEMRSTFFIAETRAHQSKYRLKGHARAAFFRWLASWGMSVTKPSDLGYPDGDFILPPLRIEPIYVETDWKPEDRLFATGLKGVTERSQVRRDTVGERVRVTAELVAKEPDESWLLWTGLNDEAAALTKAIPGAVNVQGSDSPEYKAEILTGFANGDVRVLVSKSKIAGFGMNFQRCARMAFVGVDDSWEQYYQAIRRCWRFGQTRPVECHVVLADAQEPVFANLLRKEQQAQEMAAELVRNVAEYERSEIGAARSSGPDIYAPQKEAEVPAWLQSA